MAEQTTAVETKDMTLDQLLEIPGAESIMIPEQKNNLFTRPDPSKDVAFIDKPDFQKPDPIIDPKVDPVIDPKVDPAAVVDPKVNPKVDPAEDLDPLNPDNFIQDPEDKNTGRPKLDKSALQELGTKLIEEKIIFPFDDDKPLDKYTVDDWKELLVSNFQEKEKEISEKVPLEFFKALPEELQYAAKYVADGGTDLKNLFRTLAAVEEVRALDPDKEADQVQIVRSYLQATNPDWNQDEIDEEVTGWQDKNELAAKATKFKPKLDAMTEKQVAYKIQQQEKLRTQQLQTAQNYMSSVHKVLEPGELNGLKLDRKTQNSLFAGLVQPNYPSVSGRQTNLLGHLLEKYQFVEPNHSLVAEALWLLSDPDGYKSKVRETVKKDVVSTTVRQLKTEEKNKIQSSTTYDDPENTGNQTKKIARPSGNFFKR